MLNAAAQLMDLRSPPGDRLEALSGALGFPMYAGYAVVRTGLVLATGSLVPSMAVHSAIHIAVILGS